MDKRSLSITLALASAGPALLTMPVSASAQATSATAFELDATQRSANFRKAAAEFARTDAALGAVANDLVDALQGQDIFESYMAKYGMTSADLADVMTIVYFSAAMLADGGRTDDPTQAQMDGIRARILTSGTQAFAGLSGTQKQAMADNLLFTTLLQSTVVDGLKGQSAQALWIGEFARFNSQVLGFDVTAVEVGPNGFVTDAVTDKAVAPAARDSAAARLPATGELTNLAGSPIHRVGMDHRMELRLGINNMQQMEGVVTVFVLFEDNSACIDCLDAIVDGDLAGYLAENPGWTGRWTKSGSTYTITRAGGDRDTFEASQLAGPAPVGTTMSGRFRGVDGGYGTTSIREVEFWPNGRFVWDSSTSSIGANYTAYVDSAPQPGRYAIEGYRITLRQADGSTELRSFFERPDEPGVFVMGGTAYAPDNDD